MKEEKSKKKNKKNEKPKQLKPGFQTANIVCTSLVFAGISLALLFVPRSETSEIEQRNLAEFPEFEVGSFLKGGFTNGITEYYGDTVPARDELKKAGSVLRSLYGLSEEDSEIIGNVAEITTFSEPEPEVIVTTSAAPVTTAAAETTEKTQDTDAAPEVTDEPAVTTEQTTAETTAETTAPVTETQPASTEKNLNEIAPGVVTNGQVVTKLSDGHWWGISLFGGGGGKTYAETLNTFKQRLPDVNVYSMLIPTAGEYYLPDKYASYSASHQEFIDKAESMLTDDIIKVPASKEMWNHISEPIYTRTDHHWQPLGAYYAAQTFANTAGVPFSDISTMERVDVPGYLGTMYSFTNENAHLLNDPEVFTYYKPTTGYKTHYYNTSYVFDYDLPFFVKMPVSASYSTFMAGDSKIVHIETDVKNGRKLCIFKDSYGNAEVPFYFGSFEEVIVCDMRYFDLDPVQFIKDRGVTDLLFTMCTFSAAGSNVTTLANMLDR